MDENKLKGIPEPRALYLATDGARGAVADFTGADLSQAGLGLANLSQAILTGANLTEANLSYAFNAPDDPKITMN
ncbi:MAG: pentapeptide repeat-containing protein [Deltaproteobacteria bacterium]|jgi:uncharacterized protein YjbI with pentapeptide repeats|nr:pentapeptide repeat-containing protein [Deltaproteobacteria bacterium]